MRSLLAAIALASFLSGCSNTPVTVDPEGKPLVYYDKMEAGQPRGYVEFREGPENPMTALGVAWLDGKKAGGSMPYNCLTSRRCGTAAPPGSQTGSQEWWLPGRCRFATPPGLQTFVIENKLTVRVTVVQGKVTPVVVTVGPVQYDGYPVDYQILPTIAPSPLFSIPHDVYKSHLTRIGALGAKRLEGGRLPLDCLRQHGRPVGSH